MGEHEKPGRDLLDTVLDFAHPKWKAIIAFVTPGAVVLGGAVSEASKGGENVTQGELLTALAAMVATSLGVYFKANKPGKKTPRKRKGDDGRRAVERAKGLG